LHKSMFAPKIEPVWISTQGGRRELSKQPILIGQLYMIMLMQTGNSWSSTSSSRLQMHGLICPTNRKTSTSRPYRDQGSRFWGQSEIRIAACHIGQHYAAVLHDMNNNPLLHDHVCRSIALSDNPMQIPNVREGFDFDVSGNVPVNMAKHYLRVFGYSLELGNSVHNTMYKNNTPQNEMEYIPNPDEDEENFDE
jgi:hypothetical protein